MAQTVSVCLQCERPGFDPWLGKIPWRRKWQPTLVLLALKIPWTDELGAGYYPWGRKELGMTEQLHFRLHLIKINYMGLPWFQRLKLHVPSVQGLVRCLAGEPDYVPRVKDLACHK